MSSSTMAALVVSAFNTLQVLLALVRGRFEGLISYGLVAAVLGPRHVLVPHASPRRGRLRASPAAARDPMAERDLKAERDLTAARG